MSPSLDKLRLNKRLMAYTAAAMYGGAAFDGSIEGFLPGDPSFAILPVLVSIARRISESPSPTAHSPQLSNQMLKIGRQFAINRDLLARARMNKLEMRRMKSNPID